MLSKIKKHLYFFVANYFRFWARFVLERWQPTIIVVTGSNGKTTLLHLIKSQLQDKAVYSFHANSAFGIPFHILGMNRSRLVKIEWIGLILKAPFLAFTKKVPKQKYYVVEADVDRTNEGKFLAEFLKPEITLWVSSDRTHAMGFDSSVGSKDFKTAEDAIAYEYGYFVENTREVVVLLDQENMKKQLYRTKAKSKTISMEMLSSYELSKDTTKFITKKGNIYEPEAILPKKVFVQLGMVHMLTHLLGEDFNPKFSNYENPPGRSSIFEGIKKTILFDSSYNANLASVGAVLETFADYPGKRKWAVIGDMLEQGLGEQKEHELLAAEISRYNFDRIILVGPRVKKYTKPVLRKKIKNQDTIIVAFEQPKQALEYISTGNQG
jgi:UDP-N-acetylmuramyl pentapeptide synthase